MHLNRYLSTPPQFIDPARPAPGVPPAPLPPLLHSRVFFVQSRLYGNRGNNLTDYILTFLSERGCFALSWTNRAWRARIAPRLGLPRLVSEENIPGAQGEYRIVRLLHRVEAEAIQRQTGIEIAFPPGETLIENHSLGQGAFGRVHIALSWQRSHYVAIKVTLGGDAVEREHEIQRHLSGRPNILPAIDSCKAITPRGELALYQMMELAGLGSLDKLAASLAKLDSAFREMVLFRMVQGALRGIAAMHQGGFCHLDLKLSNTAVNHKGKVQILDFGCAARMRGVLFNAKEESGDSAYFSPERWLAYLLPGDGLCDGTKVDVWAVGLSVLVLAGMAQEEIFFRKMQDIIMRGEGKEGLEAFVEYELAKILRPSPTNLESLIAALLTCDPERRPTAEQALAHPWCVKMEALEKAASTSPSPGPGPGPDSSLSVDRVTGYLREFVQTEQRRARPRAAQPSHTLSPQDLPQAHFTSFVERPLLQAQIEKELFIDSGEYLRRVPILACHGIGGVGKSHLLAFMVHQPKIKERYSLRLWIRSSDNEDQIKAQLFSLAREWHLVQEQATFEEALQQLHRYLADYPRRFGKPWLMVLDNPESQRQIMPFLPRAGGHVVVTTRFPHWDKLLSVEVLQPLESESLAKKLLLRSDPHIPALCSGLGHLALAIAQACAYLRLHPTYIPTYLDSLQKESAVLERNDRLFGMELAGSVRALWQTTFRAIERESSEAFLLLESLAYLSPDDLTQNTLLSLASPAAISLLRGYALIHPNREGSFSIHRLVQLTLRQQHDGEKRARYIAIGMRAFLHNFIDDEGALLAQTANQRVSPHGRALIEHFEQLASPSDELVDLWTEVALRIDYLEEGCSPLPKRKAVLEKIVADVRRIHGQRHHNVARALNGLGNTLFQQDNLREAQRCHEEALAIRREVFGQSHRIVAASRNNLANVLDKLDRNEEALGLYKLALATFRESLGNQHPLVAVALTGLGHIYLGHANYLKAEACCQEALAIQERCFGADYFGSSVLLCGLGEISLALSRYEEARRYFERALAIARGRVGDEHAANAGPLLGIGKVLHAQKDFRRAIIYFERAMTLKERSVGRIPAIKLLFPSLLSTLQALGDIKQVEEHYHSALEALEKAFGSDSEEMAKHCSLLGDICGSLGALNKAEECYEKARSILTKLHGIEHISHAALYNNIGNLQYWTRKLNLSEKLELAEAYYERAVMLQSKYAPDSLDAIIFLDNLGKVSYDLANLPRAIECYMQALATCRRIFVDGHWRTARILNNLADAYLKSGNREEAQRCYQEAYQHARAVLGADHKETQQYFRDIEKATRPADRCIVS